MNDSYLNSSIRDDHSDNARSTNTPYTNQINLFNNIRVDTYDGKTRQTIGEKQPKLYLNDGTVNTEYKTKSIYSTNSHMNMRTSNPYIISKKKIINSTSINDLDEDDLNNR